MTDFEQPRAPRAEDLDPVIGALKKSGFPLQTRIEHEIAKRLRSGWTLLESEYPCRSEDGAQFIDVIANCDTVVLVIECKKAQPQWTPKPGHRWTPETRP